MKTLILKAFEIYSNKILSNQVSKKPARHHNSQNVKNQLQYSIYNTSWFTPWGVSLMIFSKIHTIFHTKFRLISTICQVYRNRPITRYLSNLSLLQYTVIKNKPEVFYVTAHRPTDCSPISPL